MTYTAKDLDGEEIEVNSEARQLFASLDDFLTTNIPESRELSLAITKLEEACMWATKAVALHGVVGFKTNTIS